MIFLARFGRAEVPTTKISFLGLEKNVLSSGSPGGLVETDCWALCPTVLDLVDPEWGPRMCISHKFSGSSGNHTLRTTVFEVILPSPDSQVMWQSTQTSFSFFSASDR